VSGFYCGICEKSTDETDAVLYEEIYICSSCMVKIDEDEAGI